MSNKRRDKKKKRKDKKKKKDKNKDKKKRKDKFVVAQTDEQMFTLGEINTDISETFICELKQTQTDVSG